MNPPQIRDSLGLAGIKRLLVTAGFEGRDWATHAFVEAPAPRVGLAKLLGDEPVKDELIRTIPATAAVAAATSFDFAEFYDLIHQTLGEVDPNLQAQLDAMEQQGSAMLNTPLRQTLLASLGDEWAVYTDHSVGGANLMGLVVVNRLRDAEKAQEALLAVQQSIQQLAAQNMAGTPMQLTFRQTEVDGLSVHFLAVPMVAPAWAIRDGYLYISLYPQNVISADAFTRSGKPNLSANRDFIALREKLGGDKIAAFQFYDVDQNGDDGYQSLLGVTQLLTGLSDMFGVESPALMLPPLHKLQPHFQPVFSASWTDDAGWHASALSPFPGAEMFATQVNNAIFQQAMMMGTMVPAMGAAPHNAQRMEAATRARGIHQGAVQFSQGNNQILAPDLYTMIESNMFTIEYVFHPQWPTEMPPDFEQWPREEKVRWVDRNAGFVYLGKDVQFNADARRIVVYEKPEYSDNDRLAVCFDDNHVETLPMEEVRQRIMAQTGQDPFPGWDMEVEEGMEMQDELQEDTQEAPPPAPF